MGLLSCFNQNPVSDNFKKLICSYDENSINLIMSKSELIKGFKKIDSIKCAQDLNIGSQWFTLRRDNKQSSPIILKIEERNLIPEILEGVKQGDTIEFTMLCNIEYIQRRTKIIKIAN